MGCYSSKVDPYVLRLGDMDIGFSSSSISSKGVAVSPEKLHQGGGNGNRKKSNDNSGLNSIAVAPIDSTGGGVGKKKGTAFKGAAKAVIAINRMSSSTFIKGKAKMSNRYF